MVTIAISIGIVGNQQQVHIVGKRRLATVFREFSKFLFVTLIIFLSLYSDRAV